MFGEELHMHKEGSKCSHCGGITEGFMEVVASQGYHGVILGWCIQAQEQRKYAQGVGHPRTHLRD